MCAASSWLHGWFTNGELRKRLARRGGDGTPPVAFRSIRYCGSAIALTHCCAPNARKYGELVFGPWRFLGQAAAGPLMRFARADLRGPHRFAQKAH